MAAGDVTTGRRVYFSEQNEAAAFGPGDYGRDRYGHWWCRCPRGDLGRLDEHTVTEFEDGVITVEPSIQSDVWHGFLRNGVWRETG